MYQSILVPLDGSPMSEQAVAMAISIAQRTHVTIHLVHVHAQFVSIHDALSTRDTSTDQQQYEQAHTYLTGVARQLREQEIHVRTAVLAGPVAPILAAYVERHAIDLAVMTTHGRNATSHLWFGSVADQLVRALAMPVLLVRATADISVDQTPRAICHILIPLDGSELSEGCIAPALDLGTMMQARYTLLHVVEHLPAAEQREFATSTSSAQALLAAEHAAACYLDHVAAGLIARAPDIQIAVTTGRPSEMIAAYAKQQAVDLIAMSTHGRSGFAH